MITFIDESGKFVPNDSWSVVVSLTFTHRHAGQARRALTFESRNWPRLNGELKGGQITDDQFLSLVDLLWRHHAIVHGVALNAALEPIGAISEHKRVQQLNLLSSASPETHKPSVVQGVQDLHNMLNKMPEQLYRQCFATTFLIFECVQNTTLYFSLRNGSELGNFEWVFDAKSADGTPTNQELWWKRTLGIFVESNPKRRQLNMLDDPRADYRAFKKRYWLQKDLSYIDPSMGIQSGYDVTALITKIRELSNVPNGHFVASSRYFSEQAATPTQQSPLQ